MTNDMTWPDDVLDFWFRELAPEAWFRKDATVDETIRTRFLGRHEQVVADFDLAAATGTPGRALATIIVLDQFPRNMFRNTPRAFATDPLALSVADAAVARGLDTGLEKMRRLFLYLPFEHSEALVHQARSVELIGGLGDDDLRRYAVAHSDIIKRFGRFPHRNVILGRGSTAEELAFLSQPGSSF